MLWGSLDGSGLWGRMDSCICLVEFLHCSYETTTTLFTGYESGTESHLVMFDSLGTHRRYSPWNSPGQNTGVGSFSLLQGNLPNPGIEPRSPTLQADSLPAQPQGKPKNTGVGRLSLLQGIIPTQESNRGLLHCRWILYQLNNIPQHKIKSLKFEEKRQICDNQNKMRLLRLILPKIHDGGSIYIYIQTLYSIFFFFFFMSYRKEGTGTRNIFLHILERFGDELLPALY